MFERRTFRGSPVPGNGLPVVAVPDGPKSVRQAPGGTFPRPRRIEKNFPRKLRRKTAVAATLLRSTRRRRGGNDLHRRRRRARRPRIFCRHTGRFCSFSSSWPMPMAARSSSQFVIRLRNARRLVGGPGQLAAGQARRAPRPRADTLGASAMIDAADIARARDRRTWTSSTSAASRCAARSSAWARARCAAAPIGLPSTSASRFLIAAAAKRAATIALVQYVGGVISRGGGDTGDACRDAGKAQRRARQAQPQGR